jgi:hypothetical protein
LTAASLALAIHRHLQIVVCFVQLRELLSILEDHVSSLKGLVRTDVPCIGHPTLNSTGNVTYAGPARTVLLARGATNRCCSDDITIHKSVPRAQATATGMVHVFNLFVDVKDPRPNGISSSSLDRIKGRGGTG